MNGRNDQGAAVALENVSFKYELSSEWSIKDVSLEVANASCLRDGQVAARRRFYVPSTGSPPISSREDARAT